MVIDDAHWADAPSLRFLAFAYLPRRAPPGAHRRDAARRQHNADLRCRMTVLSRGGVASSADESRVAACGAILGGEPDPVRRSLPAGDSCVSL
jgi:hypothetical protein